MDFWRRLVNSVEISYSPSRGGQPALVEDTMLNDLRGWAGEAVDLSALQPAVRTGDQMEIIDGPMKGLSAVILHGWKDSERVAVLLSILECGAQLVINRSQLAFVNQAKSVFSTVPMQTALAS